MKDLPSLQDVWTQQHRYNQAVSREQERTTAEWMQNYILGTISELGELLEEIRWKQHRVHRAEEFGYNTVEELSDITKYVISMWQAIGCTPDDMLYWTYEKGNILEQLHIQERRPAPSGRNIVMLDLDGVIADFRSGFNFWLMASDWKDKLSISSRDFGLHLDVNHGWDYASYNEAKVAFEAAGGYYTIPPIIKMVEVVDRLVMAGWYIIVYTARPYTVYKRIWGDTWRWLVSQGLSVDELNFGYESRVLRAQALGKSNTVVALEDDPTLIHRYVGSGIRTVVYPQPYNVDNLPMSKFLQVIQEEDDGRDAYYKIDTLSKEP